jgi:L-rhamnose mutarotase
MKRIGMTWRVDPSHWAEYRDFHRNPWPELLEVIQAAGIHNYSIFAFGTRAFGYFEVEGENVDAALQAVERTDIKHAWNEQVTVWVLPEAEEGSGVQFQGLERIFFCP